MIKTKRLFKFFMLFFLCFHFGIAQISTRKHTVSRGETIVEIAKKYNVTPYEILQANLETLNSLEDIKDNDVLIIPESKIKSPQLESAADAINASVVKESTTYIVKKGDTKYSLAKRFGFTIAELERLNPPIAAGLNEGFVLKINSTVDTTPADMISTDSEVSKKPVAQSQQSTASYETYKVKYGDTKFSLAKKYDITIAELVRLNPQIAQMLQAGGTIRVPSETDKTLENEAIASTDSPNKTSTEEPISTDPIQTNTDPIKEEVKTKEVPAIVASEKGQNPISEPEKDEPESVPQEAKVASAKAYVDYKVQPNETLFGLSKKAGMSIDDFVILNPQLKQSVQVGTIIKMPNTGGISKETDGSQKPMSNTVTSRYKDLTKTIITSKSEKLLFVLPFTEAQFDEEANSSNKFSSVTDDFKRAHFEFYSGAKIAIDSIKKLGLRVDVDILDAENDQRNSKLLALAKEQHLETYDALILPFYETIEETLGALVAQQGIPVITAAAISQQQNVNNLYAALPSVNDQRKKMLDFMIAKQGNIIVVGDVNRLESKDFIANYAPTAQFVNIKKNGSFKDDDLISLLKTDQLNYVILDSDRNSVFLSVTNILLSELNTYNIQLAVLENTLIPGTDDVSAKRYRILKMLFPSLTPMETTAKLERFSETYKKVYNLSPSTNAILGFDITFDTMLRLSQAKIFEESATNDRTEYVKLKFDYKINNAGGYTNEAIYILQYETDSNIREAN